MMGLTRHFLEPVRFRPDWRLQYWPYERQLRLMFWFLNRTGAQGFRVEADVGGIRLQELELGGLYFDAAAGEMRGPGPVLMAELVGRAVDWAVQDADEAMVRVRLRPLSRLARAVEVERIMRVKVVRTYHDA